MDQDNLYCSNCGEPVNHDDRFCGACGFPVYEAPPSRRAGIPSEPPSYNEIPIPDKPVKKRSPFRFIVYILGILVLGMSLFIIGLNLGIYTMDIFDDDKVDAFMDEVTDLWTKADTLSEQSEPEEEILTSLVSRLFVKTEPDQAGIRILNIKPVFQQGIELKPGSYLLEVSAEGYLTEKKWVEMEGNTDKYIDITLERLLVPYNSIVKSESDYAEEAQNARTAKDWRNLKRVTDEGLLFYPRSAELWNYRSGYYFFNEAEPFEIRKLEALQSAEIAYEIDPSAVNATNVAWILMLMWKHYYSALHYLKEAEDLNYQEEKPELYYWMGVCYEEAAYINEASVYYNLFLDIDPFHKLADEAHNRLDNLFINNF